MIKYKLAFLLLFLGSICFAQVSHITIFEGAPRLAETIDTMSSAQDVASAYAQFNEGYPEDKYYQVHFMLDMVSVAASKKFLAFKDPQALAYILKVYNSEQRFDLLAQLPESFWHNVDRTSLALPYNDAYSGRGNYDALYLLKKAELKFFTQGLEQSLTFLQQSGKIELLESMHPYLFIRLYSNSREYLRAISLMDTIILSGKGRQDSKELLEELFAQSGASMAEFQKHYGELLREIRGEKKSSIAQYEKYYKAPEFALKDLNGKTVKLTDLRGKIVFVDFWASWCAPCLASFATMQRAVNHYADKKDVIFLFVNTLEKQQGREEKIEQVLSSRNLTFNVLLDDLLDGNYQMVSDYKVKGVPAQFVIDREGYVRYELSGFNGSTDGLLQEIDLMIENAAAEVQRLK